jgi:hypothetical protein
MVLSFQTPVEATRMSTGLPPMVLSVENFTGVVADMVLPPSWAVVVVPRQA